MYREWRVKHGEKNTRDILRALASLNLGEKRIMFAKNYTIYTRIISYLYFQNGTIQQDVDDVDPCSWGTQLRSWLW